MTTETTIATLVRMLSESRREIEELKGEVRALIQSREAERWSQVLREPTND